MTPHLNEEEIRSYQGRSLAAADLLRASDHLAACETCRARLAPSGQLHSQVRAVRRVLAAEAAPLHLSYEQLAAYVDGQASGSEAEQLETHIRSCDGCAAELAGLKDLRSEIVQPPVESPAPRLSFAEAVFGWLLRPAGLTLVAAACALALFLAIRPAMRPNADQTAQVKQPAAPAGGNSPAPGPGAPQINDGDRVITLAGGRITGLDGLPEQYRTAVQQALTAGHVDTAAGIAGLKGNSGILMGSPSETPALKLVQPLGTIVESQTPAFRWEASAGAEYQVSVFDGSFNLAASSDWIHTTEWRPSAALRRGVRYTWQLRVRREGNEVVIPTPPAPEARFQVLSATDEEEIARVKQAFSDSHLVMAVVYARAGMLDNAQQELTRLKDQNPGSEDVARMLASVQAQREGGPAKQ